MSMDTPSPPFCFSRPADLQATLRRNEFNTPHQCSKIVWVAVDSMGTPRPAKPTCMPSAVLPPGYFCFSVTPVHLQHGAHWCGCDRMMPLASWSWFTCPGRLVMSGVSSKYCQAQAKVCACWMILVTQTVPVRFNPLPVKQFLPAGGSFQV